MRQKQYGAVWGAWTVGCAALLATSGIGRAESAILDESGDNTAARLVRRALKCEVDGESRQRQELIGEAMSQYPDYGPARWHAGYVRLGDQWLTPAQASDQSRRAHRLTQYRARRSTSSNTLLGHAGLARWCRKTGLEAQARAHWLQVLQYQPDHDEALS